MIDTTVTAPEADRIPPDYNTELPPNAEVEYASLPSDVTLKHEEVAARHPTFTGSAALMVIVSLITFWAPVLNGMLGGGIGGYYSGRMNRALLAAVLSSVLVPALVGFLHIMGGQPSSRFLMGLTFNEWAAAHVIGTFIGAWIGAKSSPTATDSGVYRYTGRFA